jgi:predicted RNase H-like HicB family nuclease
VAAYIALLRKEDASDFGVDFPGCITAGSTLEEARQMAAEALAFHIEGMAEDGEPIPEASPLDRIMAVADNRSAVAFLVNAAAPAGSAEVKVPLPKALVAERDRATSDRTRFLA